MTSSAGKRGLMSFGFPPMCLTASRIVARSTTAGTPVKSCSKTRAGINAISFWATPGVQLASVRMSSARTKRPSSQRRRFSSSMRREKGNFARLVMPCFSSVSRRWISKVCAPTLRWSRVPKEFPADRGILTVLSLPPVALYDNRNGFQAARGYTCTSVNIVLISTYELGRQPFGLASPAAWLRKRGHRVVCLDLTRQSLDESAIRAAALIALYLPMHTATRLAAQLSPGLRERNPHAHLCCYGLYAPMNADYLRSLGVSTILGGEFEDALVHLAERLASLEHAIWGPQLEPMVSMARLSFQVPDRVGMPSLEKYAHLIIPGAGYRIVGSTEASRGCKHLCRHCPIVPVYKGVFRIVGREVVLEDIRRQVAAGAQHISFGDPDFFNCIRHTIQLGIRLLIPEGSRLLELEEVRRIVETYDAQSLVYPWKHVDPRLDRLSETVQALAAEGDRKKESRSAVFQRIWRAAHDAAGLESPRIQRPYLPGAAVPFLSEPWYCCAEPTRDQLVSIGGAPERIEEPAVAADGFV